MTKPPEPGDLRLLVREEIRTSSAYHVPDPPGVRIKLDANELPWPLPADLAAELGRVLARVPLNRYPDSSHRALRGVLAAQLGVAPDWLLLGNGSDEIIQLLVCCFAQPRPGRDRARVAFPAPSFSVFAAAARNAGCEPVEIRCDPDADFALDPDRVHQAIRETRPNLIFFARPNNPTGTLWPSAAVAEIAGSHPDLLVVSDEAYAAYAGDSMVERLPELPNLVVMQTLSKIGLAALRVGYLVGAPALLADVDKVRGPYNVGALNQCAARWLLEHHRPLLDRRCRELVRERDRVASALDALAGVRRYSSHANLILFRIGAPGDGRATSVWEGMCRRGVLVRCFDRPGPLSGCLRVTIGSPEENDAFLAAITAEIADSSS